LAEAAFNELLIHTATVYSTSGLTETGNITWSTSGTDYHAREVNRQTLVYDENGTEQVAQTVIWINCTGDLSPNMKLVVNGSTYTHALRLDKFPDETGTHHYKAYYGTSKRAIT